jgi:hypothetical protein
MNLKDQLKLLNKIYSTTYLCLESKLIYFMYASSMLFDPFLLNSSSGYDMVHVIIYSHSRDNRRDRGRRLLLDK